MEKSDQMSHSVVIVCLDPGKVLPAAWDGEGFAEMVDRMLNQALAPFDENADTEPYKDYEEGEPSEYWVVNSLRKAVEHLAEGTGIKPYAPDELGWSSASSKKTEEQQRAEFEREAALFATLPPTEEITWADVVRVKREWFAEDPNEGLHYEEETGRAFEWTSYPDNTLNERGALIAGPRWDWWSLGGRWTGYFRVKDAAVASPDLANGTPGLMTQTNRDHRKTDAAPKGRLDFEAMRQDKMEAAQLTWFAFKKIADRYPETRSWRSCRDGVQSGEWEIKEARDFYWAQDGVLALRDEENLRWLDDPYAEVRIPLEDYSRLAAEAAVPGWSLLTLEGEWWERGKMGWFGMSDATDDSEAAYNAQANAYLEALPDHVILAAVDVHI